MEQGKRIALLFEKPQRQTLVKPVHDGTLLETALKKSIAYSIRSWSANQLFAQQPLMTVMNNSVISWTSADELKTKELNPVRSEACLCHLSCNRGALISTVLQQITLLETIYPERAKYHDYIISSQWLSSINSIPCVLKLFFVTYPATEVH